MTSCKSTNSMFNTLLKQGTDFLNIQKDYKYMVDPHLSLIEKTTSPKLGSIIENFSQNPYNERYTSLSNENIPPNTAFKSLMADYNTALAAYKTASESLLRTNNKRSQRQNVENAQHLSNNLYKILEKLDRLVKKQLIGKTHGLPPYPNLVAGSGQKGAGDQPRLIKARVALNHKNQGLQARRDAYDKQVNNLNTLIGEDNDAKVKKRAAYYKFLVWTIVSITLIAYTAKYVSSR